MKINAGLTFKHTFILPDFSASDGWAIRGYITNASTVEVLDVSLFTGDGTSWALSIPSTTTTAYTAGTYVLQLIGADGTDDLLAYETMVKVEATAATARDVRSINEQMLDKINTALLAKDDHISLSIEGRSITRHGYDEILKLQKHFQRLVNAERRAAAGGSQIRTHQMGFTNG